MKRQGDRCKILRNWNNNMTREELAKAAGLSVGTVTRIEAGHWVKLNTITAVADVLGVSVSLLREVSSFVFAETMAKKLRDKGA